MTESLGTFNLIGLAFLGVALLLATTLVYGPSRAGGTDALRRVMSIAGWLLVFLGLSGAAIALAPIASIVVIVIAISNIIESLMLYWRTERQAILTQLAVAAEKGIPLETAVRAFALERVDLVGWQSNRLADALAGGVPLPAAFTFARYRLSTGPALAVGVGWELGALPTALRDATRQEQELFSTLRSLINKLAYVVLVLAAFNGIGIFIIVKLLPVWLKMFQEFDLKLPWLTEQLLDVTGVRSGGGAALAARLALMSLFEFGLVLLFLVLGLGLYSYDLPLVGRVTLRSDGAWLLRALAWGVRRERSLAETLDIASQHFPKHRVRQRLRIVHEDVLAGRPWADSLCRQGLLRRADADVLEAAERAGNLAWALEEMAESTFRRIAYRWQAWFQLLVPIAVLVLGVLAGLLATALFWPLIQLIEKLA